LLRLGITGIWFEKGQYDSIEGMLRLARNELRYRGVIPSNNKKQQYKSTKSQVET
jgi:hypothetical protein